MKYPVNRVSNFCFFKIKIHADMVEQWARAHRRFRTHDNARIQHRPACQYGRFADCWTQCPSLNDLSNEKFSEINFLRGFYVWGFFACMRADTVKNYFFGYHRNLYALCKFEDWNYPRAYNSWIKSSRIWETMKWWRWKYCTFILPNYDQQQPKSRFRSEIFVFLFCFKKVWLKHLDRAAGLEEEHLGSTRKKNTQIIFAFKSFKQNVIFHWIDTFVGNIERPNENILSNSNDFDRHLQCITGYRLKSMLHVAVVNAVRAASIFIRTFYRFSSIQNNQQVT